MCDFCEAEKIMMSVETLNPGTVAFCGGIKKESISDLEYHLGVFLDTRGYIRLVDLDDYDCLDHGQKIKINYCPFCGKEAR